MKMKIPAGSHFVLINDEDFALVGRIEWRAVKGSYGKLYAYHPEHGMMSRMIMQTPDDLEVDHINGDTLDNQKSNLHNCTHSQNLVNQPKYVGKSSKYKGVSWYSKYNKWRARINWEGKTILLGYFENEMDAALAYDKKAKELYREFAFQQVFGIATETDNGEEDVDSTDSE